MNKTILREKIDRNAACLLIVLSKNKLAFRQFRLVNINSDTIILDHISSQ